MKREYIEYYSVGEENKVKFIENIEKAVTLQGGGVDCMAVFHGVVVENAVRFLKRMNNEKTPRPIWLTSEIELEIKKRKNINRRKRYAGPGEIRTVFLEYMDQKNKVRRMVREAITGYEVKMAI